MNTQQVKEYVSRVNRVMDYIDTHMDQKLSLEELSKVANFSPYHFHRIFSGMVGETLFGFIQRLRLERGATLLRTWPEISVTVVALKCGFASPAAFTRAFSQRFHVPPNVYRDKGNLSKDDSKLEQALRNGGNAKGYHLAYDEYINNIRRQKMNLLKEDVKVTNRPEETLAYVRYIGPYAGNSQLFESLYNKLFGWAIPHGVADPQNPQNNRCITIYHDDPSVTDEDKLRTSVGLVVPKDTEVSGEIGKLTIPAGMYAEGRFLVDATQYGEAWGYMCGTWLPGSGYEPDEGVVFEAYHHNPEAEKEGKFDVSICIPVKKMA